MRAFTMAVTIALVVASLDSSAAALEGSSWRPVMPTRDEVLLLDQARATRSGDIVTARSMIVMPGPSASPFGQIGSIETENRFDCANQIHEIKSGDFITVSGTLLHHDEHPDFKEKVKPDNINYYLLRAACNAEFATGDTFNDARSAIEFARKWMQIYQKPPHFLSGASATFQKLPPPPNVIDLVLPEGRLAGVGGSLNETTFIDLGHIDHQKDKVTARIFWMFAQYSDPIELKITQANLLIQFDCKAGTYLDLGGLQFYRDGTLALWTPRKTDEYLTSGSAYQGASKVLCEGRSVPSENIVIGHEAAVALGHRWIDELARRAQAHAH